MTPTSANGQCLCGAINFSASFPSKWVAHCHCTRCQRALFTDPVDREPRAHAYFDTHVPWITVADGLPTQPDPDRETP